MAHIRRGLAHIFDSSHSNFNSVSSLTSSLEDGGDSSSVPPYKPSSEKDATEQLDSSPAYVIKWSDSDCQRYCILNAEELRNSTCGNSSNDDVSGHLIVIRGLPADYVNALQDSFDIDPAFLEAHASRKRYRSHNWSPDARWVHYEFPEQLQCSKETKSKSVVAWPVAKPVNYRDLMRDPQLCPIDSAGDAVIFFRASLWMTPDVDILFVDRPVSPLRRSWRTKAISSQYATSQTDTQAAYWNTKPDNRELCLSLEEEVLARLEDLNCTRDALADILSELAYDHWLELFSKLESNVGLESPFKSSLSYQAANSLEQNLEMAELLRRRVHPAIGLTHLDWKALVKRNHRRAALCSIPCLQSNNSTALSSQHVQASNNDKNSSNSHSQSRESSSGTSVKSEVAEEEANQRSLDRISYLGGILLPLTVVSSILAIEGEYGPEGEAFWVFWLASAVCSAICVFIIYLDQLRSIDAWFASDDDDASDSGSSHQQSSTSPVHTQSQTIHTSSGSHSYPTGSDAVGNSQQVSLTDSGEVIVNFGVLGGIPLQRRKNKTWTRKKLGWVGAAKKACGYYQWRKDLVQFTLPVELPVGLEDLKAKAFGGLSSS